MLIQNDNFASQKEVKRCLTLVISSKKSVNFKSDQVRISEAAHEEQPVIQLFLSQSELRLKESDGGHFFTKNINQICISNMLYRSGLIFPVEYDSQRFKNIVAWRDGSLSFKISTQ